MKKFIKHEGLVVPLDRSNVDTDAILPKQYLKSIRRTGFGAYLFDSWRYTDIGEPDQDCSHRPKNPDFVLNKPRYEKATVLLARANFGCGSSREHAPWALEDYGFRVIIAPSFAEIFYNNCFKNGILPIVLTEEKVSELFSEVESTPGFTLQVDLQMQKIIWMDKAKSVTFDVEPALKERLIKGLDDVSWTLGFSDKIREYEKKRKGEEPWAL